MWSNDEEDVVTWLSNLVDSAHVLWLSLAWDVITSRVVDRFESRFDMQMGTRLVQTHCGPKSRLDPVEEILFEDEWGRLETLPEDGKIRH